MSNNINTNTNANYHAINNTVGEGEGYHHYNNNMPPPAYNPNINNNNTSYPAAPIYGNNNANVSSYPSNQGPPQQDMRLNGELFLADCEAILVRQHLQVLENVVTCCECQNKYHIAKTSVENANASPPLTDQEFWTQEQRGYILEESNFCLRICCQQFRPLKFHMYRDQIQAERAKAHDPRPYDFIQVDRPFRCTLWHPFCPCCMICPPLSYVRGNEGRIIGSTELDWNCSRCVECCIMGRCYLRVKDEAQESRYYLRPEYPTCCNGCQNCCAPTCCNPIWKADIVDSTGLRVVGNYKDNYPGMVGCRCISNASNFSLTFPADASPLDKSNLLGALMLSEMLFHERKPGQNN